jgi:hypothetical protein
MRNTRPAVVSATLLFPSDIVLSAAYSKLSENGRRVGGF